MGSWIRKRPHLDSRSALFISDYVRYLEVLVLVLIVTNWNDYSDEDQIGTRRTSLFPRHLVLNKSMSLNIGTHAIAGYLHVLIVSGG